MEKGLGHGFIQFAAVLLCCLLITACASEEETGGYCLQPGDSCPAFEITDTEGKQHRFPPGKGCALLVFFHSGCPDCDRQLPVIEQLYRTYGSEVRFLGIGRDHDGQAVSAYRAAQGYGFPMAADPHREIYRQFAGHTVPRVYLIRDGIIVTATDDRRMLDEEQGKQLLDDLTQDSIQ